MIDAGDERFHRVLLEYAPALARLARVYARDAADAEDLMQEIAFALWRALPTFRDECSERTFVYRVAHNRGLTHRERRRLNEIPLEQSAPIVDRAATPDVQARDADRSDRLRRAIAALPATWQHVVMLRLEGLTDREIAIVVGITEGNVAVRLTRARKALRHLLGEDDR